MLRFAQQQMKKTLKESEEVHRKKPEKKDAIRVCSRCVVKDKKFQGEGISN